MGYTIDLFMWGYQQLFQISLQVTAEGVFSQIDRKLNPSVFLLGILVDEKEDRHPVCLEPEDVQYPVRAFERINDIARELERVDEESRLFHSHPIAQANHDRRVSNKAYIEAIKKILKKEDLYGDIEHFVSYPTYIDGFLVFVVLELSKATLNNYYSLTKDKFNDRYVIQRSFIESAVSTFLKECSNALKDPNQSHAIERNTEEIIRESGKQFMYTISQCGRNFDGLHGLYDACNTIASLKYEGAEGLGKMVIAYRDHPNVKMTLQLKEPIRVSDFRKVRKFLELSNDETLIISDSALIYGLGKIAGKYNPKQESLFLINFISHFKWEVLHDNNSMMVVEYRQPSLPKDRLDREKFYSDLKRIFVDIDKQQLDELWDVTIESTKQKHGTMLVISDKASKEALRLGKQGFPVKPFKVDSNIIQQITSIDGSVLLDRDGYCHTMGVILDGLATDKGDSSRGARYNSAIRYYEQFGKLSPTVIVIISEDGMINLIPNLRPQIRHSQIIDAINSLQKLELEESPKYKYFNRLIDYFKSVEFYLSEEECKQVNLLRVNIEKKFEGDAIKIVRSDLTPNSEMNDSYFTDK